MFKAFINAFKVKELRGKILFTMGLLILCRVAANIPCPGVDMANLDKYFTQLGTESQAAGQFLGMFDLFSGGALQKFAIGALGIMPYISASIIMQLLVPVVPSLEKLQRTGVVELDENFKVLGMEEKPQQPKSHWAVPPFYIYLKKDLDLVRHSVENGCGKDAPGNLAHYMVSHTTMHAWPMSAGRFDIGSLDTYYLAVEKYGQN